jgi:hypothetical protein
MGKRTGWAVRRCRAEVGSSPGHPRHRRGPPEKWSSASDGHSLRGCPPGGAHALIGWRPRERPAHPRTLGP